MKPFLLTLALLGIAACTQTPGQEAKAKAEIKAYSLSGEVIGMDPANQVVILKHQEIKGFMEAMTMGFPVKEKAEFEKFKPGQKVNADLKVQGDEFWLEKIVWLP